MPSRGALEDAPANYCCRAQTKLDEMAGKKKTRTNCEERVLVGSGSDPPGLSNSDHEQEEKIYFNSSGCIYYMPITVYHIVCKIL